MTSEITQRETKKPEDVLYAPPTSAPSAPAPPPKAPAPTLAEKVSAALYSPRKDLPVEYRHVVPDFHAALTDELGLSADDAHQYEQGFATDFATIGLDPYSHGKLFYELQVRADLADVREEPEDAAQLRAWEIESRREMRATWGDQADRLFEHVKEWVAARPALCALLERRGIGMRPDVVRAIFDHVHRINP